MAASAPAAATQAEGADAGQAHEMFVIRYEPGPAWKPGVPMGEQGLVAHFHYLRALHQRGAIALAGPVGPDGGLIVLRVRDRAEADRVMGEDPAVTGGIFVGTLKPFTPRFVGAMPAPVAPR